MNVLYEDAPSPNPGKGPAAPAPSGPQRPSQMLKQKSGGAASPGSASAQPATPVPSASPAAGTGPATGPGIDEKVYREFCDSLARAIESANLPGFDFFEFHQLYNRFRSEGRSEEDAVQTALTSAETMRVSKNALISNYKHYEKVLGQQQGLFEKELEAFYNENIKGAHQKQQQIDNDIAAKEEAIKKLIQEIESLKEQKENMGLNAEKAAQQTEEVKAAFSKAFDEVSSDFRTLVEKIVPTK